MAYSTAPAAIPFHDDDAERAVLGAILAGAEVPDLEPEDFYRVEHGLIWTACLRVYQAGNPIDPVIVKNYLESNGQLERVGGATAISSLIDSCPDMANTPYHAGIVRGQSVERELRKHAARIVHGEATEDVLPDFLGAVDRFRGAKNLDLMIEQFAETIRREISPRGYVIEPCVAERSFSMIYGIKGTGKTYCALTLAVGVAAGRDVLGWRIPEPRRVLVVDGELDEDDLRKRIGAICRGLELTEREIANVGRNLFTLSRDRLAENGVHFGYLTDPVVREALRKQIPPDTALAVFDNLSCLFGGEENDAAAWDDALLFFLRLKHENGTSILLVHHAGKGGDQRGNSRREDSLDMSLRLELIKDQGELTSDGVRFRTVWAKHRGFRLSEAPSMICELDVDREAMIARWTIRPTDDLRIDALVEEFGISRRERDSDPSVSELHRRIRQRADDEDRADLLVSRATVGRLLQRAREMGLLEAK